MSVHILEAADYGVAQLRPRTIFIANRFGLKNPYPKPQLKPEEYAPIEAAIDDLKNKAPDPAINHEWTKHKKDFVERIKQVKPGCSLYEKFYDAYKRQYKGVPSMTIKENHGGTHIHYELDRCISAREMARLQSFPDSFIFEGTMKKAMWQIGNAVAPVMFKNIALGIIPQLESIKNKLLSR
jgi:DNA (cytosine-5)-methyltransferase 1